MSRDGDARRRVHGTSKSLSGFANRVPGGPIDRDDGESRTPPGADSGSTDPRYGATAISRGSPGGPYRRELEQAGRVCRSGELRRGVPTWGHRGGDRIGRPGRGDRPRRGEHGRSQGLGRTTAPGTREPARLVPGLDPSAIGALEPDRRISVGWRHVGGRVLSGYPSWIAECDARRRGGGARGPCPSRRGRGRRGGGREGRRGRGHLRGGGRERGGTGRGAGPGRQS